jgi:hypothetical protein
MTSHTGSWKERATWDLMFKYFLGLVAEELPDHATLLPGSQELGN